MLKQLYFLATSLMIFAFPAFAASKANPIVPKSGTSTLEETDPTTLTELDRQLLSSRVRPSGKKKGKVALEDFREDLKLSVNGQEVSPEPIPPAPAADVEK